MAQKLLHELLKEDHEPFLPINFMAHRRRSSLNQQPSPKSHFKPKPISHSSDFPAYFCNTACFFSFAHSSDLLSPSPVFEFQSPAMNSNAVLLHAPAATARLLVDAALRIQKHSTAARAKSNGLRILGSFLKRLTHRGRSRKREIDGNFRRNDLRGGLSLPVKLAVNEKKNESVSRQSNVTSFDFCESNFCDSPFRFVLQSSPSAGYRTPEFSPPPTSPARHDHQANDVQSLKKLPVEDEEEEKEHSSPVSVLDPPFEDDDEGHYEDKDENDYDMEHSYAIIQKAKHQVLKKLRRFERLAKLDPIELETFLLKDEEDDLEDDDNDIDNLKEEEKYKSHNFDLSNCKKYVKQANGIPSYEIPHVPEKETERLVYNLDLVVTDERDEMKKRVYMRTDLWKQEDSGVINAMMGQDLKAGLEGWNRNSDKRGEIVIEIELDIFSLLVEELQTDLTFLNSLT